MAASEVCSVYTGYPLHKENREMTQKESLSGKTQGIWKFLTKHRENTGNCVCSIIKFPILKVKDIARFVQEAGYGCQVRFVYAIINHQVNWHRKIYGQTGKTQ